MADTLLCTLSFMYLLIQHSFYRSPYCAIGKPGSLQPVAIIAGSEPVLFPEKPVNGGVIPAKIKWFCGKIINTLAAKIII